MKKGSDSEVVTLVIDRTTTVNTSVDSDFVNLSWNRYKKIVPLFIPSSSESRVPSPVGSVRAEDPVKYGNIEYN